MCKGFNSALHVLLVIAAAILVVSEQNSSYCGPLKVRLSEYEACYDANSENKQVPCPAKSKKGTKLLKVCRPPYSYHGVGFHEEQIMNVTYTCEGEDWEPPYDYCQSDCGRATANNRYPWLVAIYDVNEKLIGTGTIISAFHVLTDSNCLRPEYDSATNTARIDVSNYIIIAGKHYSNIRKKKEWAQIRKIKKATIRSEDISDYISILKATHGRVNYLHAIILLETDSEFEFFDRVQPICLDWSNYYEQKDFSEGNEAVVVGWDYNKTEVVPRQDKTEFNIQYWHRGTCTENLPPSIWRQGVANKIFCGTYVSDNQLNEDSSRGVGLYFKSSPWRYYLKGMIFRISEQPGATYMLFTAVSFYLTWLKEEMRLHPNIDHYYSTKDMEVSTKYTGCELPEHIKYGRFQLILGETYRPRFWVPTGTRILRTCAADRYETPISTRCELGEWQPPINKLECQRPGTCPGLLSSASEDIFCRFYGQEVNCTDPENNTTAVIRCKPFHRISGNRPIYKCQEGLWDQPFTHCTLECGVKRVGVATLAIGGSEVIKNEYPWVVAVYRSTEQICGGTIISRSYVLSAAHCFTTPKGLVRKKELYTIVAGKHYRNFSAEESSAQSRKIKSLHVHEDYRGSVQKFRDDIALIELDEELIPSLEVQPACMDWDSLYEDFDFADGNNAVVAGWGYTEQGGPPSEVLKKVVLPYRPKAVCIANLPESFSHQYVATDKICAGYKDSNISVCEGDSGGGLYFESADNRLYIRGIVSLTPTTAAGTCNANRFALYTKVSRYLPWIEKITRRVL